MISKIPSLISKIDLSKLEHIVKMAPAIKDFFSSYHTESESYLLSKIKEQDKYIWDKKTDISKLREENAKLNKKVNKLNKKIKDLEETLIITEELRVEAEVKLGKAGGL